MFSPRDARLPWRSRRCMSAPEAHCVGSGCCSPLRCEFWGTLDCRDPVALQRGAPLCHRTNRRHCADWRAPCSVQSRGFFSPRAPRGKGRALSRSDGSAPVFDAAAVRRPRRSMWSRTGRADGARSVHPILGVGGLPVVGVRAGALLSAISSRRSRSSRSVDRRPVAGGVS